MRVMHVAVTTSIPLKRQAGRHPRGSDCRWIVVLAFTAALLSTHLLVLASPETGVFSNLGPSLAASMSHGTTVALPCRVVAHRPEAEGVQKDTSTTNESSPCDGVLILIRTPKQQQSVGREIDKAFTRERKQTMGDLQVWPHDALFFSAAAPLLPQRWNVMGETCVACMTGFSPEVHFLTRLLEEIVDSNRRVLESHGIPRTPPAVSLMKNLALQYQSATMSPSSRPFGVAVLMVGRSSDRSRWHIWTLDPSGNLRSGRMGAIGKESPALLQKLLLDNKNAMNTTPREALERLMRASVKSLQEASVSSTFDTYEAVLVSWMDDGMHVGQVCKEDVQACLQSITDKAS